MASSQSVLVNRFDRVVFESELVRIAAFRCHPEHPSFQDTGPAQNYCFVFPRTAVLIQHEHEPAFVANPNVVTFYNSGQSYLRNTISPEGDRCDWFGVNSKIVWDAVRPFDSRIDNRPERPFQLTRGSADASTYLLQRNLFTRVASGENLEPLAVEETVIDLLDQVVRSAYRSSPSPKAPEVSSKQRSTIHDVETILSRCREEHSSLTSIACEVGLSPYHLCRLFRQVTGTKLHQYRLRLRLRTALTEVIESARPLTDIALDAGFSSHSHFTESFRREFGATPSAVRAYSSDKKSIRNFLIAPSVPVGIVLEA